MEKNEKKDVSIEDMRFEVDRMLLDFTGAVRNIVQVFSNNILSRDKKIKELEEIIKKRA